MFTNRYSIALLTILTAALPAVAADQNLIIVSIGDSLAAGEGNPNSFNAVTGQATWLEPPCHRSTNNGRRIASNRINSMTGFSTSFFDFSCSGAKIDEGILGTQLTSQPNIVNKTEDPQIDQVEFLQTHQLNNQPIDILMISIGVNDVNFASVVTACLTPGDCTHNSAVTTATNTIASTTFANAYGRLVSAIRQRLNVKHVYITGYPDEVKRDPGTFCGDLDTGDLSMSAISQAESSFMLSHVITPLNNVIANAVTAANAPFFSLITNPPKSRPVWHFLRAMESNFATHGFCTALDRRYMNTLQDSLLRQGDQNGTMHPNLNGHRAYADALVAQATVDFDLPLQTPKVLRRVETNVGIDAASPVLNVLEKKLITVEIAQNPGALTVTLQHRVVTHGLFGDSNGDIHSTTMADTASGALNLFAAQIPGSDNILPGLQTLQYRIVATATRNGQTATTTTDFFSIDALLEQQ